MKRKLRLMLLHNGISPIRNPLFEELSKKYDLTVYFCKEKNKERRWATKLTGYSFKYKILPNKQIGIFTINPTLKKELKENIFDVYICDYTPESFFQCLQILKFCNIRKKPFIFWCGNTIGSVKYYYNINNGFFKKIIFISKRVIEDIYLNQVSKKASSFISYSKATTDYLISKDFEKKRIFAGTQSYSKSLLPNPTWKNKPKKFRDKKVLFNIGYLREGKGINYLIEAFNKLNRKDALLLIAGTGDQEDKLKELAKGNKNIIFLGYKDGIDKANYYSIADFFVFPTLYDVWGHVVTESFYYGCPIICTDKAEAKELIEEGKTGFIVPDKDSDALAESMKKLLDNPRLLKQMKENVKKIPKSKIVDIQTTVKTFEDAINYGIKKEVNKTS